MFIRHPEPQLEGCHSEPQLKECHVLNPYPEPQLKGYVPTHNSRNTNKLTLRCHRSLVEHTHKASNPMLLQQESPGTGHLAPCAATSRPLGGGHVPLSANAPLMPMLAIAWQNTPHRQAPVLSRASTRSFSLGGITFSARRHAFQASLVFLYHLAALPKPPDNTPQATRCHTSSVTTTGF